MIQILHSAGYHWLTVSTVGTEASNVVRVYDILESETPLPLHTKKQIASLLKTKESCIRMKFVNVQVSTIGQFYYNSSHVIHFFLITEAAQLQRLWAFLYRQCHCYLHGTATGEPVVLCWRNEEALCWVS